MARRAGSSASGLETELTTSGQPRGLGPDISDVELDGSVLGRRSGFRYATGREKVDVGDVVDAMNRGHHSGGKKT